MRGGKVKKTDKEGKREDNGKERGKELKQESEGNEMERGKTEEQVRKYKDVK